MDRFGTSVIISADVFVFLFLINKFFRDWISIIFSMIKSRKKQTQRQNEDTHYLPQGYGNTDPWIPMSDPVDIKYLGKLCEELNECGSIASRCLIQGIDQKDPNTGIPNQWALENEIADVLANVELNIDHWNLNMERIRSRADKKKVFLQKWHNHAKGN